MGFFRIILIALIIYYIARIIFRILTPILLNSFIKKMQNNQSYTESKKREEGEITIENVPKKNKKNDNLGEYVDFEEIDE